MNGRAMNESDSGSDLRERLLAFEKTMCSANARGHDLIRDKFGCFYCPHCGRIAVP